jgi:AraC-like DNA-binding protein
LELSAASVAATSQAHREFDMFAPSKLRTHLLQAQAAGYRPEEILAGSGVSWTEIESLQPVALDTIARLFDFLARRTHPGFAIAAGHMSTLQIYGVVGAATMNMPTLRAAFEHWSRYYLVSGDPIVTSISERDDYWCMHFEPRCLMSSEARRFCIETSVAALEPVIKQLTDATASTLKIDFSSNRPPWEKDYRVFGTDNIRFNRRSTTYYGRRSDLDRPIPLRDCSAGELFLRHCDEYLATLTSSSTICDRLDNLMCVSPGGIPSLEQVAKAMNLSIRSLQRELRTNKMTYQELVRRYRLRQAKVLLREKRPVIKDVAYQLGFKDVGSFRRAFHSWTGKSVGAWQREQSSGSVAPIEHAAGANLRLMS